MNSEQEGPGLNKDLLESEPAIDHLEQAIRNSRHWYLALLESINLWTKAEEVYDSRTYRYLIAGEAFDWLLLAERLCNAVHGLVPDDGKTALLFHGHPPLSLSVDKFRELIGEAKYLHYLNFFYGVIAEEALVLAVEEEVRKEKRASGLIRETEATTEAYRRIYDSAKGAMLRNFRKEQNHPQLKSIDLTELKEFAYWRFKFRLKICEKAKVASDSRKALIWLNDHGSMSYSQKRDFEQDIFIEMEGQEQGISP